MSPRFRNLLTHPKFWRIVGFVSSLIGTLCYAQSLISFQHVGDVKNHTLKISLYGVVSFTIIFVMLFARKGRFSKSFPLKALVGVLALMLTSLYNFFSDKDNNNKGPNDRKTDVFNLISNGSFALMLLSLSKQIDLGCEGELLSFYLGCLTIQLMKINMGFVLVGAAYCYLLNILHSYADSNSDYNEASCHIGHVAIEIDNAKGEERSEQQLYSILGVEIKSDDEGNVMYYYPEDLEAKLVEAIASGFEKEHCYNVFCRWRRQFLLQEELLLKQDLNIEGVQKLPLKYLKDEIENWNKASKVAFRTLFPYERQLCDRVFGFSHDPFADSSFMEICREPTIHLLGFAKSVAKSTTRSSPERLFNMLLVFETLNHLLPDLKSVFSKEGDGVVLWNEAVRIWKRLKGAIRVVFMELENMILHQDPSKVVVFGGGLHPINHYVMNYLFAASQFWKTLEIAFEDDDEGSSTSSTTTIPSSCGLLLLCLQVVKILEVLERNLKASSKIYKDSCLASVFMMNNWRYIVHKVKKCELRKVLGDEWVQRHVAEMGQYLVNYQRRSWDQVLGMLNSVADDDCDVAAESSMEVLKMKLGEICEMQGTWVVIDEKLREVMKSSLKKILLPAVEKFVARFQINDIDHVQQVDCGVVLDVAALVDKLFLGKDEHRSPRIIQPTWTIVLPNTQDLYEWRKYDEKKTLNSTYPRKYYRCIYKNDQGCRARKHVQQIQKNPKMYTTSYSGFHTCSVLYVLHKAP